MNETNIITHPSLSRNRSLTQLLADLRIAEREGIGVDRMVREMVRWGHQPPDIREISGPYVRASLVGDALDEAWIAWLGSMAPSSHVQDVNSLLLLWRCAHIGWVDATRAAALIQLTAEEASGAIARLAEAEIDSESVIVRVGGLPSGTESVWRLSRSAVDALTALDDEYGHDRVGPTRLELARSYAQARGRISTTELGDLVSASPTNVGSVLTQLEREGDLVPSSEARRGRGFHYRWVPSGGPG